MYFACFCTLLIFGCFVQHGLCTNCTIDQLGAEVPASACDVSKCKTVTIDQLNNIKNNEVLATKWNLARDVLVSDCPLTYTFVAQSDEDGALTMSLNITIKYGSSCDQITYYPMTFKSTAEDDGGYKIFETEDGDAVWDLCFPYLDGSNFIYRRCRTKPTPPEGKGFATIYVYEVAEGPKGEEINTAADSLGVQWDKTTVDCL